MQVAQHAIRQVPCVLGHRGTSRDAGGAAVSGCRSVRINKYSSERAQAGPVANPSRVQDGPAAERAQAGPVANPSRVQDGPAAERTRAGPVADPSQVRGRRTRAGPVVLGPAATPRAPGSARGRARSRSWTPTPE